MLSWSTVVYGAVLSAVVAAVLVALVLRPRRASVIVTAGVAAGVGPAAWNAILNAVHAPGFFTDAPIVVFPVSWQDTGSGVFALAVAGLLLGLGPLAAEPGRRVRSARCSRRSPLWSWMSTFVDRREAGNDEAVRTASVVDRGGHRPGGRAGPRLRGDDAVRW